ncbi:MAG: acyl-CoA dehydrogenase, partial [Acidimicrobiia bacterium]|nr:acyl-CoA dehydrogenase [Acidimicrobiia bacterium]
MRAPGVEVRPLRQITDEAEFNEVFFSDVFVPDDRLVGPLNEGWRVANSTLTHERGINPRQLVIHVQLVEELLRLALESGAFDDDRLRPRLAQAAV